MTKRKESKEIKPGLRRFVHEIDDADDMNSEIHLRENRGANASSCCYAKLLNEL